MPDKGFKSITVSDEIYEKLFGEYQKEKSIHGYRSFSQYVTAKLREVLDGEGASKPRFEHFNVWEDHVSIIDNQLNRIVDVYVRNERLHCEYDQSVDCAHVGFAWSIEKVRQALKK